LKRRKTKQKEIINKEINTFKTFFTAEDLYEKVEAVDKTIGLATIYRFLKTLREEGTIFFYTCDGTLVYSKENRSHCHFVCEETGRVIHFTVDSLDFLKDKIPGLIRSFQIEVKGVCTTSKR